MCILAQYLAFPQLIQEVHGHWHSADDITNSNFLVSKPHCYKLKQTKYCRLILTQYHTMYISILDDFQHLVLTMLALD